MKKVLALVLTLGLLGNGSAETKLCLEGICIGDDVDALNAQWVEVVRTYDDDKFIESELGDRKIEDIYFDYNERLVADNQVLKDILPYVIRSQRFDRSVLDNLLKVRAICSSLTLTGEAETKGSHRLFVTFRAVADDGRRGKLRVVRLEKQFNIMAPHLRPNDAEKYRIVKRELKKEYPDLANVRDIDGRVMSNTNSNAVLGFRFLSDVSNPLVLKLIDTDNIDMIEEDENISVYCN